MIERMRLRNFRRYRDATLRFKPGVNFIEGLNNVGKTSLFYAIEYALFGRVENFKTIRALMPPGMRSLGVELVFVNAKGERYLLQRVHQMPPKSKKTMDGHFTLKAIADDGERYLLASDFGDTEDKLALKLQELTGLTRRFFSVALHMRQGEIASILDGARQLDIVLGVTAASMAEDELRQMALELEKESAGLAVLLERLRSVGNELTKTASELAAVSGERQATADKLTALGDALADPRGQLDKQLAPLNEKLSAFEQRIQQSVLARRRLDDEQQRKLDAIKSGSPEEAQAELTKIDADAAGRAKAVKKLRADLDQIDTERRQLDQQRGDLAGRIERRKGLPTGKGAKCEVCGAPIKPAQMQKEMDEWTSEIGTLDKALAGSQAKRDKAQTALDKENADERKQLERAAQLKRQLQILTDLDASLARRQKEADDASAVEKAAFAALQAEARSVGAALTAAAYEVRWNLDAEPVAVIASIREAIQSLKHALAERVGRQIAERKALTDLLQRFDSQMQALARRHNELEREQAATQGEANIQQTKAARAARFRRMSTGFKDLQVQIRSEAATRLAADTLALHRKLAERDEFSSLTIDPAHYSVQVVPRDLGEEVPAALYEGGGHRLLLGLSFRLAVARLVEQCPFLMLDEPTYGLDKAHREALLRRIGSQDVSRQILLVTHQAAPEVPGHRIQVSRQDREAIIVGAEPVGGGEP